MEELRKKMQVFATLNKKSKYDIDVLAEQLKHDNEIFVAAKKELNAIKQQAKLCNEKILKAMTEQLNVSEIQSLHLFAEKLESEQVEAKVKVDNAQKQLEQTKARLLKGLSKGKVFENAFQSASLDHQIALHKKLDQESEDIWVAQRSKG